MSDKARIRRGLDTGRIRSQKKQSSGPAVIAQSLENNLGSAEIHKDQIYDPDYKKIRKRKTMTRAEYYRWEEEALKNQKPKEVKMNNSKNFSGGKQNPEKKAKKEKKPKTPVNLSEVAKKAWAKRREKYGDSGISPEGMKSIKKAIEKNSKKNSK